MRIAWDNSRSYWAGTLFQDRGGCWKMFSDFPTEVGETLTITPLTTAAGPHIEFRARVLTHSEDVLESTDSPRRFAAQIVALNLDAETEAGLHQAARAA